MADDGVKSADIERCALNEIEGLEEEELEAREDTDAGGEREAEPEREPEPETLGEGVPENVLMRVDDTVTDNDTREDTDMLDVTVEHALSVTVCRLDGVGEVEGSGDRLDDGERVIRVDVVSVTV